MKTISEVSDRLGLPQGTELRNHIRSNHKSIARFCRENGFDEQFVSLVCRGERTKWTERVEALYHVLFPERVALENPSQNFLHVRAKVLSLLEQNPGTNEISLALETTQVEGLGNISLTLNAKTSNL